MFAMAVWLSASVLCTGTLSAQDDGPWWKQIFSKKETTVKVDPPPTPPPLNGDVTPTVRPPVTEEKPVIDWGGYGFTSRGSSSWLLAEHVAVLLARDTAQLETTPGFRIQLRLGRLDAARNLRKKLEADTSFYYSVDVSSMPPLFSVTAGEFTDALRAHRAMMALRMRFPTALVIPSALDLKALFPEKGRQLQIP